MRVLKFGGTSVANAERFIRVADILDAEQIFSQLLDGLPAAPPEFNHAALRSVVEQEFAQLKQLLHGISLLKYCPDSVNATIICRGEKLSIALMKALSCSDAKSIAKAGVKLLQLLSFGDCSGQLKLATALEFFQYLFSDSFGGNPPLYSCGLSAL